MERILLVDDNRNFRLSLKIGLTREGYRVETAQNVVEAIQMLVKDNYDFLLTDIKMPKLNGYDLAKVAKEMKPEINIVLLSAYDFKEYDSKYPGFADIPKLNKPFEIAKLLTIMNNKPNS